MFRASCRSSGNGMLGSAGRFSDGSGMSDTSECDGVAVTLESNVDGNGGGGGGGFCGWFCTKPAALGIGGG